MQRFSIFIEVLGVFAWQEEWVRMGTASVFILVLDKLNACFLSHLMYFLMFHCHDFFFCLYFLGKCVTIILGFFKALRNTGAQMQASDSIFAEKLNCNILSYLCENILYE